jgi:hypothetical protein
MKIEIEEDFDSSTWVEAGTWFKQFVNLGMLLGRKSKDFADRRYRLLLAVPKKEFVTAAIAFGMSIQKFLDNENHARVIHRSDLPAIEPGTVLRLEWKPGPRDVVFKNLETKTVGRTQSQRIHCFIEGIPKIFDLRGVESISVLPSGFPEGEYLELGKGETEQTRTALQERWRSQEAPALAIFSDLGHFKEQLATRIRYAPLEQIAEKDALPLEEASRIDYLFNDIYAHFVNVFAHAGQMPATDTVEHKKIKLCQWVVLDGNSATTKLSAREEIRDLNVISLIELGTPLSQGKAFQAFTSELNRFNEIPEVTNSLGWEPPAGAQIWGWAS